MMYRLYTWFGFLVAPFLPLWLARRAAIGKEDASRTEERYGISNAIVPGAPIIWLHAASVGESQSILPLTAALHEALPHHHMLVTTGTRTSAALLEAAPKPYLTHQYVPLDIAHFVRRFLARWRPHLAIWVESEIWPHLLLQTTHRHIPMMLVNGRISARSFKRWGRMGRLAARLFGCFDAVFAGSEEDAARLRALGAVDVEMAGNLKFDAPALPVDDTLLAWLKQRAGHRPVWLAASTHPGEEELILKTHARLRESFPNLLTLLAPRHAARGGEVAALMQAASISYAQRSAQQDITDSTEIYLADTMGELGTFYRFVDVAFVAGSLIPHGGHNPLEPARLHCAILTGSHTHNFAPIVEEMLQHQAIIMVADATALAWEVQLLLSDIALRDRMAAHASMYTSAHHGATAAIVARAKRLLAEGGA